MNPYSAPITIKARNSEEAQRVFSALVKIASSPHFTVAELEKLATLTHNGAKVAMAKRFS